MSAITSYRDLTVWQVGMEVCLEVYRLTGRFPTEERFGLVRQLRRVAVSIPSKLAEGHTRDSTKKYLRFVSVARGSLAELVTQPLIASRLAYLGDNDLADLLNRCEEQSRMLTALRSSLRRRTDS